MSGGKKSSSISTGAMAGRRAALTATVDLLSLAQRHSEVGKVFGLTEDVIGKLADTVWAIMAAN